MSPRRNHRRDRRTDPSGAGEGGVRGTETTEDWRGEEWVVRRVTGAAAVKHYRCPGCDQEITPGLPHVVAWQRFGAVEDRRHWHSGCWQARDRRAPVVRRSRNAPRY
ncbi:ATP/GTP-binding protein [Streptomyces calidiresistens]|uniref:ATP/GTP-binding protein n=1 Tax=Streptomyces calidiresistens TaxID=1485586 RepID=A0A7W3T5T0_9ACTN|nr:ATP/GTP-binding protein [Streptomyces calidiresistens]MBB0231176.1 ATP/GTP-binding protein [Streptomyces calidiresistens]